MTTSLSKTIRFLYGILLSICAVAAGICLIAACLQIYHSGGEQIYTAEKVAAAFSSIAFPIYVFLALTAGSFLLALFVPTSQSKKPERPVYMQLHQLRRKADMLYCGPQLKAAILRERKMRRLHTGIALGLLSVGSIVFLCYALNSSHFDQTDINGSMVQAMYWMLPCMAVPFGYGIFAACYGKKSMNRECGLLKEVPKTSAQDAPPRKADPVRYVQWGLLAVAAVLLVGGFLAGGYQDVLTKAVNICTECVGLG